MWVHLKGNPSSLLLSPEVLRWMDSTWIFLLFLVYWVVLYILDRTFDYFIEEYKLAVSLAFDVTLFLLSYIKMEPF